MLHTYCIMISFSTWLPRCLPVPVLMSHTPVCDLLKSNKCQHFYLQSAFEDLEVITSTFFFYNCEDYKWSLPFSFKWKMKALTDVLIGLTRLQWAKMLLSKSTLSTAFPEITVLVGGVAESVSGTFLVFSDSCSCQTPAPEVGAQCCSHICWGDGGLWQMAGLLGTWF